MLMRSRVYKGHTRKRAVPMITTPMKPNAIATSGRAGSDAEKSNNIPATKLLIPASLHPTFLMIMATICGHAFERSCNPA